MIRTKGEAGTGDVVEAVRHARTVLGDIRRLTSMAEEEMMAFAKELGARKVRVNSVNPGMVESEGLHAAGFAQSDFRRQVEAQTPLGRIGQPDDIAPAVAFLASPEASWITGESWIISGGNR